MNWLMAQEGEVLRLTLNLRSIVLESITESDLDLCLAPHTQTMRELLLELLHWENSYAQSYVTRVFTYLPSSPLPETLEEFKRAFVALDATLIGHLEALTNEELEARVDRGSWSLPMPGQFHTFRETVIIFAAKASVYLRAWERPLPQQMKDWIG